MQLITWSKKFFSIVVILLIIYLVSHFAGLNKLPVFADEAIYIRWAQLIIDDPMQYFFFPLNDGKTPLFIWQLIPVLSLFEDPLFAARLVSLIGGAFQVLAIMWLIKELKGNQVAQLSGAILVCFLPFWFFHHRMALMDGWLTVWITLSLVLLLRAIRMKSTSLAVLSGLCLGASSLTKIPAVLAFPSLLFLSVAVVDLKKSKWHFLRYLVISGAVGAFTFALLKFSPSFSQLFSRGGDFLFSFSDIKDGIWFTTIKNTPSYINYFWTYSTPPVVILFFTSLFMAKNRKVFLMLWLSFLGYYLPIALMGRSVFPRYLFPSVLFMTITAALVVGELYSYREKIIKWSGIGILALAVVFSIPFMYFLSVNPNKTPFVSSDVTQYLTEWSAGHGIYEVYQRLLVESENQKIAVATEGYFGTLPDGLLMYLYNQKVDNIAVQGIGQPVTDIPEYLIDRKDEYDQLWLVVNSHRRKIDLPPNALIASYCRPYNGPCLELWDLTQVIRSINE